MATACSLDVHYHFLPFNNAKKNPISITFPHSTGLWDLPLCSSARSPFRGLVCSLVSFRSLPVYQWSLPWPLCLKLPSLEIFTFLRNCHIIHFTYMFCLPPFKLLQSKYFCLFDSLIYSQRLRLWWAKYVWAEAQTLFTSQTTACPFIYILWVTAFMLRHSKTDHMVENTYNDYLQKSCADP